MLRPRATTRRAPPPKHKPPRIPLCKRPPLPKQGRKNLPRPKPPLGRNPRKKQSRPPRPKRPPRHQKIRAPNKRKPNKRARLKVACHTQIKFHSINFHRRGGAHINKISPYKILRPIRRGPRLKHKNFTLYQFTPNPARGAYKSNSTLQIFTSTPARRVNESIKNPARRRGVKLTRFPIN